jgi:hypothetical protein
MDDAWVAPVFDTSTTWGATPLDCPMGPARRPARDLGAQRRFALGVLHYNIQYVAGGLTGFTISGRQPYPAWTDDRVQDAIVTESLVPVLGILDRHPTWTLSLEMQGYMLEVLLARHRDVAQHLSDLVRAGRVELVSFHYSDQLFLAYPRHHMDESRALNTAAQHAACVEASGPVFTQEGQFGEGMADVLGTTASGSDAVIMLPKNLFSFFHGDGAVAPYYDVRGTPVVIAGRGVDDAASGFSSTWVYMNDAELLATDGINPYFPDSFVVHPAAVAAFETNLEMLEASGYAIAGVGDWVATLRAAGVMATPLPPMLDGTWQPDDTGNLDRWMGDAAAFAATERDDGVLAGNQTAGRLVLGAEVAVAAATAAGHAPMGADAEVTRAWRDLLLGEVSDTTGWNPIAGEVYYGEVHAGLASARARTVATSAAAALGVAPPFVVDTASGTVVPATMSPDPMLEDDPSPPFAITPPTGRRAFTARWQRVVGESDHHVLTIDFAAGDGWAEASLPWTLDRVSYTPALLDGQNVEIPLTALTIPAGAGIPIDAGPFGLATDQWLVLDAATISLAARLDTTAHTVTFRDATLPTTDTARWVLHVVAGTITRAQQVADRVNLHPRVRFE